MNRCETLASLQFPSSLWHKGIFHVTPLSFCQRFRFEFCGSENWCLQNERFKDNTGVGSLAVRKELKAAPKAVSKLFCPQNEGPTFYGLCQNAGVLRSYWSRVTLRTNLAMGPQNQHDLKELHGARASLVKEQTRILNRQKNQTLQLTRSQGKKQLDQVKKQIAELNEAIEVLLRADPRTSRNIDILKSIPGIGAVSAATVLIEMPEIGTLTRKEAASLTGVAPMTRQSGKWQGKSFIQGGRKTVRDALYMPALVAARRNPDLKAKYDQMVAAGKPPKIALTALMRKLIETGNALIKADRLWLKNVLD